MRAFFYCFTVLIAVFSGSTFVYAASESFKSVATHGASDIIRQRLLNNFPEQKINAITAVAEGMLYRVELNDGQVVYSMPGGQYFLSGELFELQEAGVVNLSELDRQGNRVKLLDQLLPEEYLTIPVATETVLATVYIVVDADCYYCQLQYAETPLLSQAGVEVRYLSRSRNAPNSRLYQQVRRTWCSNNPTQALDLLMQGRSVAASDCTADLLKRHIELAESMGVKRLPATITADGQLVSGLLKTPQILKLLAIESPVTELAEDQASLENLPVNDKTQAM